MDRHDFFKHLFGSGGADEHKELQSNNPTDFMRSVEIADGDCLMMLAALATHLLRVEELSTQQQRINEDLAIVQAEHQITQTKLFRELREKYPDIQGKDTCGVGFRKFEGRQFYVAWGHPTLDSDGKTELE